MSVPVMEVLTVYIVQQQCSPVSSPLRARSTQLATLVGPMLPTFAECCRYQEQGEKLQVDNFRLSDELEAQKVNLKDINEFLTNELKARSLTTSALEEKVLELTQKMEDIQRECEVGCRGVTDAA